MRFLKFSAVFSFIAMAFVTGHAHADTNPTLPKLPTVQLDSNNLEKINGYKVMRNNGVEVNIHGRLLRVNLAQDDPSIRANSALLADLLKTAYLTGTKIWYGWDGDTMLWAQFPMH